jgi:aminopeptidase N
MKSTLSFLLVLSAFFRGYTQERSIVTGEGNGTLIDAEKKALSQKKGDPSLRTSASGNFDINYYRCEWELDPAVRFIKGKVTPYFTVTSSSDKIVFDLSDALNIDSIIYHGAPLNFQRPGNDALQLQFSTLLSAGTIDSLSISYSGVPRSAPELISFYTSFHAGVPVIHTISEPYGAKEWWPCKNGLTDKTDSIDIFLTCPDSYSATTNGVLLNEETAGGKKTAHFRHGYPIATYLVGIACTNYVKDVDSVRIGNRMVPVIMNAYPELEDYFRNASFYAKQSLQKFSELFGDYPFIREQYSQTEINGSGGMEHQTNSFIGRINNQLVAHELSHHWFGDKITCKSWQHIWLNEGFADYAEFLYVENFDPTIKQLHLQAHANLALMDSSGSVFVTDTTNPGRIFDNNLTYRKGGYVVHMLRGVLGDSVFFKAIRTYLNDPLLRYNFAATEDLQRNLELASGRDLGSFFKKWIYGEGYPNYNGAWYQNNNNWASVQLNQSTTHPSVSFYEMPVQLRFKSDSRDTIITVNHQYSGQVIWLNPGFKADSMFIDPYLWILAKERIVNKLPAANTTTDFIKIYPNPAPGGLYISIQNPVAQKINCSLYNSSGQLVWQSDLMTGGPDEVFSIPLTRLAHGIYILRMKGDKNLSVTRKIVH